MQYFSHFPNFLLHVSSNLEMKYYSKSEGSMENSSYKAILAYGISDAKLKGSNDFRKHRFDVGWFWCS